MFRSMNELKSKLRRRLSTNILLKKSKSQWTNLNGFLQIPTIFNWSTICLKFGMSQVNTENRLESALTIHKHCLLYKEKQLEVQNPLKFMLNG